MSILEKIKESFLAKMLLIIIIPWIVLAIIFGFIDLQITKAVANPESLWGQFGADWGEAPGYGLIAIAIGILLGVAVSKKNDDLHKQKIPALVLAFIGLLIMAIGLIIDSNDTTKLGGGIGVALLLFYGITRNKDWTEYKTIASIILLLAIINPLLFVQIVKVVWGRTRPRDVLWGGGVYTPWFIINGATGNKSFPSGHTAMGWMLLPLLILVREREWKDPVKILTWVGVIGWGLFVGASRVVVAAHFASDVLFSTGVASVCMILLYYTFYMRNKE